MNNKPNNTTHTRRLDDLRGKRLKTLQTIEANMFDIFGITGDLNTYDFDKDIEPLISNGALFAMLDSPHTLNLLTRRHKQLLRLVPDYVFDFKVLLMWITVFINSDEYSYVLDGKTGDVNFDFEDSDYCGITPDDVIAHIKTTTFDYDETYDISTITSVTARALLNRSSLY